MRRIRGLLLACGLVAAVSAPSKGQDILGGDVAGFGPAGVSNGFGYAVRKPPAARTRDGRVSASLDRVGDGMRRLGMQGYWTGLYYPSDANNGPGVYYSAAWNGLPGYPTPDAVNKGWTYSPPWSKAYRQGEPRKHKLFAHLHHDQD